MVTIFLLTTVIIGLAMLVMAVGVLFSNRCLRGSCGGEAALGPDGDSLSCETCPMRKESNA
ncbi:MAG: (Na+)-NQR maturation NqrM [Vicinamibacteria bacterium]